MTLPEKNLDDKTFNDLVKDAVSRIPIYAREWTDHNIHDPGRTFIELFAWLAEMQLYSLNRITDRSRRKFLKLLGIPKLNPARAAEVDVIFSLINNSAINGTEVPMGTMMAAKDPDSGEDILFETKEKLYVAAAKLMKILTRSKKDGKIIDNSEANRSESEHYHAFSYNPDKGEFIPNVGDELYLGFDRSLVDQEITLAFHLIDDDLSKTGRSCKEKPDEYLFDWYYVPGKDSYGLLTILKNKFELDWLDAKTAKIVKIDEKKTIKVEERSTLPLSPQNYLFLRLNDEIKKVNLSINDGRTAQFNVKNNTLVYDSSAKVRLSWKYYTLGRWDSDDSWRNVEGIKDETRHFTASGKIRVTVKSSMGSTAINNPQDKLFWLKCRVEEAGYDIPPKIDTVLLNTVSAVQAFQYPDMKDRKFPGNRLPCSSIDLEHIPVHTLEVKVNDMKWNEVDDFDASMPGDTHYTVDLAKGRVVFGDGINGKVPEGDIFVSYRSGGGARGNVKPHTIRVFGDAASKVTVDNMKAASGGEDAETLEEAILRARKELSTITRAATSDDYEMLTKNTPGLRVARAKAIPRYHPLHGNNVSGTVTVVVIPQSPYVKPSEDFLKSVYRHLEEQRLLATELFVIPPEFVTISVSATVVIKPKYVVENIEDKVKVRLKNYLDPITGGPKNKGWDFGRSVYVSEIYESIDRVDGVDYVENVILSKNGEKQTGDIQIPAHYLVCSGDHTITAKE